MDLAPLVDIAIVDPRIRIDLRYATARNMFGVPLYPLARALLRAPVARRLVVAQNALVGEGFGLKLWDAYRPLSVQKRLWEHLPDPNFIAPPTRGSRHNRGASVDVTLVDAAGADVLMPTEFDEFTPAAHRRCPTVAPLAAQHRDLLDDAMRAAGFVGIETEWWHYDARDWERYGLLDVPLDAV
ncbi:MAG: M15 family metallopeptidase [Phycisphaerae bacterium]